jgi:Domain of unknown function (DUF1842)
MSTSAKPIANAYLVKTVLGNTGMAGAPIAQLALVVDPATHKVTGQVQLSQAVANGHYAGYVHGTIFATGFGETTQVIALTGTVHPEGPMPMAIPFSAHLAVNQEWVGTGGFNYANVHVATAPVKRIVN